MKILSASQIKEADAYTIENEPISSIDLMERASLSIVKWYIQRFDQKRPIIVFCGNGNNGGDGLAIARLLIQKKFDVKVYTIGKKNGSPDFLINHERLEKIAPIRNIQDTKDIPLLKNGSVIFDAIFGSGLTRNVEGVYADVIKAINRSDAYKIIAVDIASGLFADIPSVSEAIIKPHITLSFQAPKLAFLLPENEPYVGDFHILDINLSKDFLDKVDSPFTFLTAPIIAGFFKPRKKYAHKGDFGKALLIAGSKGKMGASILCSQACLRTGVGLMTVHAPSNCWPIIQMAVPEAMVEIDEQEDYFSNVKNPDRFDAIGIGPGLGTEASTVEGFEKLLKSFKKPMVFDADAINIFGKYPELLKEVTEGSIFTPHPKEFERMVGSSENNFGRLSMQREFSEKHQVYLLLKGAHTSISTPEGKVFFNATGNSGMATGGSGDILTGMITSVVAQRYDPLEAVLIAVYIHGLAADFAMEKLGKEALLPTDIIAHIGESFMYLQAKKKSVSKWN